MKVGDLIKFRDTGAIALILKVHAYEQETEDNHFLDLYVGDGTLDGTPSASGLTSMSTYMAKRAGEVISESR